MEICTKFAFWYPVNRLACMRKPQTFNTLTVRVITRNKASTRRLTMAILHGTSPRGEQGSADAVAKVQIEKSTKIIERLGQKNCNRRANMAASWRQRNLRNRWHVRQYKMTPWVCQGRLSRHQPMNWHDFIRASGNRDAQGHSQSVKSSRSVEWTYDRELHQWWPSANERQIYRAEGSSGRSYRPEYQYFNRYMYNYIIQKQAQTFAWPAATSA